MRAGQTRAPSFQARLQGIQEVHVQHRDSPELMVSHFLDEQLHSNDVFGFVFKIIWQLAWELVPSTCQHFLNLF